MEPISTVEGRAYPLGLKNVDTDMIIAAKWLKTTSRNGLGKGAFEALRTKNPDNVFDDPTYAGSPILIAGDNFGCGSSREHAAWALADMGVRVVIAPSFSDIFSGNAYKNGILLVALPQDQIDRLMRVATSDPLHVDLDTQTVTTPFQDRFAFPMDAFRKHCLSEGLDEIGLTLASKDAIAAYETKRGAAEPWLVPAAA